MLERRYDMSCGKMVPAHSWADRIGVSCKFVGRLRPCHEVVTTRFESEEVTRASKRRFSRSQRIEIQCKTTKFSLCPTGGQVDGDYRD